MPRVPKPLASFWERYEPKWSISPDWVAERLQVSQLVEEVTPLDHDAPQKEGHTRFVCMSDTHSRKLQIDVPAGDVLLHAGDMTKIGQPGEFVQFSKLMQSLPHKYKVVIPGNHELGLDPTAGRGATYNMAGGKRDECLKSITDCIFLEDHWVKINGIKIYGSPWQPEFAGWAYNLDRGAPLQKVWEKIPDDTDVLMTHGPPIRHGDLCNSGLRAGCVDLMRTIQTRVHPKYHVFGHIHEDPGMTSDGETYYINASTCNRQYRAVQDCIVFDVPNGPFEQGQELKMGPKEEIEFPGLKAELK